MQRSPGIYLTAEENPGKPRLGDSLLKAVQPVIGSNGVLYLQMSFVGSHSMSGKEKEEKERKCGSGIRLGHSSIFCHK